MSGSTRVFVSYRREDTRHLAGRLADRLVDRFGVFMDMDTIEPGTDFTDVIKQAVADCDVFMAVIGTRWATVEDEAGVRRLDDPDDWVVAEIAAALNRQVPVIPVLVDGARMPTRAELPEALAPLASRQAMTIRHESFSSDVNRLISTIERRLGAAVVAPPAVDQPPPEPADPAAVEADYTAALAAFFAHRWDQAAELFQRVLTQQPQHASAAERLAETRRHLQLDTWNAQADQAAAGGRWYDAVVLLENIKSLDPNYPDLARRLQAATTKRRVADLHNDIKTLAAASQWTAVLAAGQELAALDPGRADPEGLVSTAKAAVAEAELEQVYAQGIGQLDRGSPAAATTSFEAVLRQRPDFRDAPRLLAEARRRVLAELYARAGQAETAGDQPTAIDALQQITRLDPANAEAARRLRALRGRPGRARLQPTPTGIAPSGPPSAPPSAPPVPPSMPQPLVAEPPPRKGRAPWLIAGAAALVLIAVVAGVLFTRGDRDPGGQTGPTPGLSTSASAASPSPTPTPTPTSTASSDTSGLRTHIPADIRTTCTNYAPPAGDALEVKLVGALRCAPTGGGVPASVWYFQFPDTAAMDTAYAAYVSGDFTKGDCTAKRQRMTYTTTEKGKTLPGGLLHCYETDGDVTFAWTHDALHIVTFAADGKLSYKAMKKWWGHAGPYREP